MLEKMNKVTTNKYAEMKSLVGGVNQSMRELNAKCKSTDFGMVYSRWSASETRIL